MDLFIICFAIVCLVALFISYLLGKRNELTFAIRMKILDTGTMQEYESLPSYSQMLYNPLYFHLWSYKAWLKWIKKNIKQ